jgi:outer membrane receptor protein involved in Fe transport
MKTRILVLLAVIFSFTFAAQAQTSRGTVSGIVTDTTGAAISGATVTLTNTNTSVSNTTTTNDEGFYRFDAVILGNYSVKIEATGFGDATQTNIIVNANQTSAVDAQLAPGNQSVTVDVTATAGAELQTEAPVRGANISPQQISQLPLPAGSRDPVQLALTVPGVSSNRFGFGIGTFSVNGARGRSNTFLIDGIENNDTSVAGQGFTFTNPDAIQEVSVQTSNFDAEFGRAGGGVINTITKSGTNDFNGTLTAFLDSTVDDAITSSLSRNPSIQQRGRLFRGTQQIYSGTIGGPVFLPRFGEGGPGFYNGRNRTFFFASYQEERRNSDGSVQLTTLSQAGRDRLRQLFPVGVNPRVDTLLNVTRNAVANTTFQNIDLGAGRGQAQFGTFLRTFADTFRDRQLVTRLDHSFNDSNQLTGRFIYGDQFDPESTVRFEGFDAGFNNNTKNIAINYVRTFSSNFTNDFRVGYNRIRFGFPIVGTDPLVNSLPQISITNLSFIGVQTNLPQGRLTNNYTVQNTSTYIRGKNTFRFGFDFNKQRNRQNAPFNSRGSLAYTTSTVTVAGQSTTFTGLANYIDDFGGGGTANRDFGSPTFSPAPFRQSYFFQDRLTLTPSLTLTLGLRYDNFGVPANALRTPAFTGLFNVNPVTLMGPFSQPNEVRQDNNNFGPTVGFAYAPTFTDGILGSLIGEKRTVFRAGYQVSYDSFFDNITSNALASSPNTISTSSAAFVDPTANAANPRGTANLSTLFPANPRPLIPGDGQTLIEPNLVAPYYQKFSAGIQRELPFNLVLDVAYVGNKGTKLYSNDDRNPLVPAALRITPAGFTGTPTNRLDNLQGARLTRVNGGSSIYHSGQLEVRRRFANNYLVTGNYTYSKLIDNASEVFGSAGNNAPQNPARPVILFSERLERGVSLFDRTHRATFTYVVRSPFFNNGEGFLGKVLGGFELAGVTTFESGAPLNVFNGVNADQIGGNFDRPDFNPNGQRNVRAIPATATSPSTTGFINPDVVIGTTATGASIFAPIDPNTAQFIGVPTNTALRTGNLGRNTLRTPGTSNFNVNVTKRTRITEGTEIEFRTEFFNIFNHPQYTQGSVSPFTPGGGSISADVFNSLPGEFLNPNTRLSDGGGRVIRYQLKLRF